MYSDDNREIVAVLRRRDDLQELRSDITHFIDGTGSTLENPAI